MLGRPLLSSRVVLAKALLPVVSLVSPLSMVSLVSLVALASVVLLGSAVAAPAVHGRGEHVNAGNLKLAAPDYKSRTMYRSYQDIRLCFVAPTSTCAASIMSLIPHHVAQHLHKHTLNT